MSKFTKGLLLISTLMIHFNIHASTNAALKPWDYHKVPQNIYDNILYLPISDNAVKNIQIKESNERLVDLLKINNPRIKPLSNFSSKYQNSYEGYSKVRQGVYEKLTKMLEILPKDVGIAYFEGFRPLAKQKEYFNKKFKEILETAKDKELAYQETSKLVSPFINNIPTHTTGAAIDMALFQIKDGNEELLDMGKFDVIFGPNDQQETFSRNI